MTKSFHSQVCFKNKYLPEFIQMRISKLPRNSLITTFGPLLSIATNLSNLEDCLESYVCFIRLENLVCKDNHFISFLSSINLYQAIINTTLNKRRILQYFISEQVFLNISISTQP